MSRFSSLQSHHSATRELERQRLERMMKNLRREVEVRDAGSGGGTKDSQTRPRFQPQQPSSSSSSRRSGYPPSISVQRGHTSERGSTPQPGPGAESPEMCIESARSVEIAWLMSAGARLDAEAELVEKFLGRHGLERYAVLLTNDPVGSSLDALRQADDALLASLGLAKSPRTRLLTAIAEDARNTPVNYDMLKNIQTPTIAVSPPESTGPARCGDQPTACSQMNSAQRWGCLKRVPPGWHDKNGQARPHTAHSIDCPTTLCNAASGNMDDVSEVMDMSSNMSPAVSNVLLRTPLKQQTLGTASNLDSNAEKVCCYECFKQVYAEFVVPVDDPTHSVTRTFCNAHCANRFREALRARIEREHKLGELRISLNGGVQTE